MTGRDWARRVGFTAMLLSGLASSPAARAGDGDDIVFLKAGGRARGFVMEENPTTGVRVRLVDGTVKVYAPKDVDHVEYAGSPAPGGSASPGAAPPPEATAVSPAAQSAATTRFQNGKRLAQAHRCREAIVEFRASLDLVPSPATRLALGRCYLDVGQVGSAHETLERAAHDAQDRVRAGDASSKGTASAAASEAGAIASRVPHVTFVLPGDAPQTLLLTLDGQALQTSAAGTPMELDPGPHVLGVKGNGAQPHEQSFEAHEGESSSVTVVVERAAAGVSAVAATDPGAATRANAAAFEAQQAKEAEEKRAAAEWADAKRERADNERAAKRAMAREAWRFTVGLEPGFANGVTPFGSVTMQSTGLAYGAVHPQTANLVGPMIDLALGVRKSLAPRLELDGAASVGTIRVDGVNSLGDVCASSNETWNGCGATLPTGFGTASATVDPVLVTALQLGVRIFLSDNGAFFLGTGARAMLIRASGNVTASSELPQAAGPYLANVYALQVLAGGYLELGWYFGYADDWSLSFPFKLDVNSPALVMEFPIVLTKSIGGGVGAKSSNDGHNAGATARRRTSPLELW